MDNSHSPSRHWRVNSCISFPNSYWCKTTISYFPKDILNENRKRHLAKLRMGLLLTWFFLFIQMFWPWKQSLYPIECSTCIYTPLVVEYSTSSNTLLVVLLRGPLFPLLSFPWFPFPFPNAEATELFQTIEAFQVILEKIEGHISRRIWSQDWFM